MHSEVLKGAVTALLVLGLAVEGTAVAAAGSESPSPVGVGADVSAAFRHIRQLTPAPGRRLHVPDIPGRQHLWCRGARPGAGQPTVVVVSGAGDFSLSWRQVQSTIAAHHRICTYDRPGLGWSNASGTPRTARHIIPELTRLLRAADVRGPLVVVGHSMGGIYARMFAARHLSRVRGVVLVDPGDEHLDVAISRNARRALNSAVQGAAESQTASGQVCATGAFAENLRLLPLATVFPPRDARIERRLQAGWCRIWRTTAAEGRGAARTWAQARRADIGRGSLGRRPLAVIVSSAPLHFVSEPALDREIVSTWRSLQRAQTSLSTVHRFSVARGSSHAVMLDRPGAVAARITWVLRRVHQRH
ncbi:MAG: alpha/beta hydrolase [Candidatus Nanopelagicales bacterium]